MFVSFFSCLAESFDLPVLDWIASNLRCPLLDFLMPLITHLGDGGICSILLAVLLIIRPKNRKIGLGIAYAMLIGLVLCNLTLKPLIARIRPFDYQLEHFQRIIPLLISAPHDFSFPSGHTIAAFETATVLLANSKKAGIPAMILAGLIAFSRLYLYVHYPTDVLAAILLGIGIGLLGNRLSHCTNFPKKAY